MERLLHESDCPTIVEYTNLLFLTKSLIRNKKPQLLNVAVHSLLGSRHHSQHNHDHPHHQDDEDNRSTKKKSSRESVNQKLEEVGPTAPCCSSDPVERLQTFQRMASVLEHEHEHKHEHEHHDQAAKEQESELVIIENNELDGDDNIPSNQQREKSCGDSIEKQMDLDDDEKGKDDKQDDKTTAASDTLDENSEAIKKLQNMGLNTALAIGLHNFPEGLATFVAALGDPAVGAVLAIAIAIHNIPEGTK
jgi:zinc transporter ZupT